VLVDSTILSNFVKYCKISKSNLTYVLQPAGSLATFFDKLQIMKDPYGVVLIMGTWNYPIQISLLPVVGAIAAGNCVVVKPSEVAPASAQLIADLLPKYLDNVCHNITNSLNNKS
jgi:acyl-CoA reductase-like NAD-dependent aldehyde dehydrogenase